MPCSSFPVSIWENEYGECGGCEAGQFKVPVASSVDRRTSSELQMVAAVKILLHGIGEDVEREGILKTPVRVAKAFQSFFSGYELSPEGIVGGALFTEAGTDGGTGGGSGGMVVVRKIDSFALCDTCLLPFRLRSHVAYIPSGQRVVGLSKLPRVVNMLSRRLQNPQKLANELVQALFDSFEPLGVAAAVESWHLEWPGVSDKNGGPTGGCAEDRLGFGWVPTTVYAARGKFENVQSSLWDEFLGVVEMDGIEIRRPIVGMIGALPGKDHCCPFFFYTGKAEYRASVSAIALAVESLVRAEGEQVSREDLQLTASRYVNWLLSATEGSKQKLLHGTVIDTNLKSNAVYTNGNSCCNHPRLTNGGDVQQGNAVGLVSSHLSNGKGVVYGCTNGIANGHGNDVHYAVASGAVNGHSNGICHDVSKGTVGPVQNIEAHSNGVHLGVTNGYSNGLSHGASTGGINGVPISCEICNGGHHLITSGNVNGYNNGKSHAVPNGIVNGNSYDINRVVSNGAQSNGELVNGGVQCGIPLSCGLDNQAGSLFSLELDLPLSSLCEHHLLPFFGVAHVGYLGGRLRFERSLVLKIVRMFSRRLQVQERLTRQIAESIASLGDFQFIMVVVEANHMCIMSRGAEKLGSTTATVATVGQLASDGALRAAFLKRISRKGPKRTNS